MRAARSLCAGLLGALLMAMPAAAVQPDEILEDPALEARARVISEDIRCLVCRNENIDASNAELARDLRLVVRERLVAGDSDDEVKEFLVARYGEYVLLTPQFTLGNAFIWLAGPALLLLGGVFSWIWLRRQGQRRSVAPDAPLSDDERRQLGELMQNNRE